MTELDPAAARDLDLLVSGAHAAQPDWADAVARGSTLARRTGRRRRLRLLLAAVAAAVLLVPPYGVGGRLLDFLGTVAPGSVARKVAGDAEPRASVVEWLSRGDRAPVDPGSVHGVLVVDTPRGPIRLWAARARDGSVRYRFVQLPGEGEPTGVVTGQVTGPAGPPLDAAVELPASWPVLAVPLLHGQVKAPAASVRVRYPDGGLQAVPAVEGYVLATLDPAARSAVVEALDVSGRIAARSRVSLVPPGRPVVTTTRRLITIGTAAGEASLFVEPGENPRRCFRVSARNGDSGGCGATRAVSFGLQQVGDSGTHVVALLHGAVARDVVRLRLRLARGWVEVPLTEGYFLLALAADDDPAVLEATSGSGRRTVRPVGRS